MSMNLSHKNEQEQQSGAGKTDLLLTTAAAPVSGLRSANLNAISGLEFGVGHGS